MSDEMNFFSEAFGPSGPEDQATAGTKDQDQAEAHEPGRDQDQEQNQDQDSAHRAPEQKGGPEDQATAGDDSVDQSAAAGDDRHGSKQADDRDGKGEQDQGKQKKSGQDEDLEEIRRQAEGYKSMLGRLQKEQQERRRIEEEKRRLEQQLQQDASPQRHPGVQATAQQSGPAPEAAQIPEDIKEDVDSFARDFPEYSNLVQEKGPDGDKLRKRLKDYGPEIASAMAEAISARREASAEIGRLKEARTQEQQAAKQRQAEEHFSRIFSEVPEYGELRTDRSRAEELQQYHNALWEWVGNKSYREAVEMEKALKEGDAPSVSGVLKQFQDETRYFGRPEGSEESSQRQRQNTQPEAPSDDVRKAAAQASAVPSRAASPPRGRADPNDERSAFREAFGGK